MDDGTVITLKIDINEEVEINLLGAGPHTSVLDGRKLQIVTSLCNLAYNNELMLTSPFCVQGNAVIDFTGTGPQVAGNCNAPRAVTLSALIYCLRCMVGHDVPLNQASSSFRIVHMHIYMPLVEGQKFMLTRPIFIDK